MIELCQKPSQCGILVAALPGGDDLFLLPFAHERDEDEVVGIVKAVGAVVGQERDPLLPATIIRMLSVSAERKRMFGL